MSCTNTDCGNCESTCETKCYTSYYGKYYSLPLGYVPSPPSHCSKPESYCKPDPCCAPCHGGPCEIDCEPKPTSGPCEIDCEPKPKSQLEKDIHELCPLSDLEGAKVITKVDCDVGLNDVCDVVGANVTECACLKYDSFNSGDLSLLGTGDLDFEFRYKSEDFTTVTLTGTIENTGDLTVEDLQDFFDNTFPTLTGTEDLEYKSITVVDQGTGMIGLELEVNNFAPDYFRIDSATIDLQLQRESPALVLVNGKICSLPRWAST